MICQPCRANEHGHCPEVARQADTSLSPTDRAGSRWCDCAHEPRGISLRGAVGKLPVPDGVTAEFLASLPQADGAFSGHLVTDDPITEA